MSDWPSDVFGYRGYGGFSTAGEGSVLADALINTGNTFSSAVGAWGTANLAVFIPMVVGARTTIYQLAWINGATVAGNIDVGIHDRNANRIVSAGSTAQAGVSVAQVADITDTVLEPGLYYLAMAADDATATVCRPSAASQFPLHRASGCGHMASAFPLPATATIAGWTAALTAPLIMGSTESTVI